MGEKVSIRFVYGKRASPYLFSYWDGETVVKYAKWYVRKLKKRKSRHKPLDRREPGAVMVDFIRLLTKDMQENDDFYHLEMREEDGDNGDLGHFDINLALKSEEGDDYWFVRRDY